MTITIDPVGTAATATEPPATSTDNLVTLIGGIWLTAGLFIDGYAHSNIIDTETEDFFTPWHGLFYSGFAFTAGWVGFLMYQRRNPNGIRTWIPPGYGWAVVGVIAFGIGGIGDGIWHTKFGIEVGIDALLSPTHLLLLYGLILLLAAPLQAVLRTGGSVWMPITSVTILALLAAFFTSFIRPFGKGWALGIGFDPRRGDDIWASWMVGGVIIATTIMCVSALYLLQRFPELPFGAVTVLWLIPATFEAIALSSTIEPAIVGGLLGGLTADVVLRQLSGTRRFVYGAALSIGSVVAWSAWTLTQHLINDPVAVPAEVWTGQIVLSAFVALGITMLAIQPSTQLQPEH